MERSRADRVDGPAASGPGGHRTADRSVRALGGYLVAAGLVRFADEGARVALVLLAIQRTDNAGTGGILIAALLVPHVVAAPAVGLLVDRARQPRWVLAVAAFGFAAALAVAGVGVGRAPLPVVLGVLVAGGCCGPALTGALTSQLSELVPAASLPRAFGLDSLVYNLAGIAGPAVAGVLAAGSGAGVATTALSASAAVGALTLAVLPIGGYGPGTARAVAPSLTAGVLAVVRDRVLVVVTGASSAGQLGTGALPVVAAVLATRAHSPARTGVLLTAVAAGALIGSLVWTLRPPPSARAPLVVMVSLIGIGVPLAIAAASTSLTFTTVLFAVSGLSTGPFAGALFTARQDRAPEQLRAQVFTIAAGLKTTTAAAGAGLAGAVAQTATSTQLLLAAACPVFAGSLGLQMLRRSDERQPRAAAVRRPPPTAVHREVER